MVVPGRGYRCFPFEGTPAERPGLNTAAGTELFPRKWVWGMACPPLSGGTELRRSARYFFDFYLRKCLFSLIVRIFIQVSPVIRLSDLLLFELEEAPGAPFDDVVEVSNYIAALEHGMGRLREGFPYVELTPRFDHL